MKMKGLFSPSAYRIQDARKKFELVHKVKDELVFCVRSKRW